jgi:hypothetical protein
MGELTFADIPLLPEFLFTSLEIVDLSFPNCFAIF